MMSARGVHADEPDGLQAGVPGSSPGPPMSKTPRKSMVSAEGRVLAAVVTGTL